MRVLPSAEYLLECFDYNPETGELRWKARPQEHFATSQAWKRWITQFSETTAGHLQKGYIVVKMDGRNFRVHRVIWKMMTGADPSLEIDHKDGVRANNRWANLRLATDSEQNWNSKLRKTNTTGRRGVSRRAGRWQASIHMHGAKRHLGYFSTVEEASLAYETVASGLHGEFYQQPRGG